MSGNKVEEFMKKHPPWFLFDFHPIRFSKKILEEEEEDEKEIETEGEKGQPRPPNTSSSCSLTIRPTSVYAT